jgi:hypothetical protein
VGGGQITDFEKHLTDERSLFGQLRSDMARLFKRLAGGGAKTEEVSEQYVETDQMLGAHTRAGVGCPAAPMERAAERRHPTGRERTGSPTLQPLQEPIFADVKAGGSPLNPERRHGQVEGGADAGQAQAAAARRHAGGGGGGGHGHGAEGHAERHAPPHAVMSTMLRPQIR